MDLKDALTIVSVAVSAITMVGTVLSTTFSLASKNLVANWRNEALEERNQDREELRKWIEERYLPAREADSRIRRVEDDHRELSSKVNENERRLRIVEQARGAAR